MSKVTIDGVNTDLRPPKGFAEAVTEQLSENRAPDTEVSPGEENLSLDERIRRAKEATQGTHSREREQQAAVNKDRYKSESGKTTYYYENISIYEIAWSHPEKNIPSTPIGGVIDFFDYFDKEEDIINFKSIRKNEFPNNIKPLIRRLTPAEYLRKIERNRTLETQKNKYHAEVKGKDKTTEDDKVSSAVQFRVQEYLTWESRSKEEQAKSNYSKYDFMQWVSSWTFTEPEFRLMMYQIKDAEVLKAIAERKQELHSR